MHWFKLANKQLDYEELLDVEEKYKLYENRIATLLRTVLTKLGKMGCQL